MIPWLNRIYEGDAEAVLATWPGQFVDLCLTSPPYYQLRDYGVAGQLGMEETPEEYIKRLVGVVDEIGRVLKDSGSLYLNLGDTYSGRGLMGIPWRVALALNQRGWLLRNSIVWHKINALPTSATTRFRSSHEFLFFFTKSKRYYFDLDAVREPHQTKTKTQEPRLRPHGTSRMIRGGNFPGHPLGKNPADVWSLHTENRPKRLIVPGYEGHFAPFPESLCEKPILASCPPWGIVLDPFIGSGTTAVVARRLGRNFLGIDLSGDYVDLAARRLQHSPACSPELFPGCSPRRTGSLDQNRSEIERSTPTSWQEAA